MLLSPGKFSWDSLEASQSQISPHFTKYYDFPPEQVPTSTLTSQNYRVAIKVGCKLLSMSLSIIDRFSKIFHRNILWKICNKVVTKHTTTP